MTYPATLEDCVVEFSPQAAAKMRIHWKAALPD